jgi:multidrug efflux pump subunit AcrA (membrane-fusion protein)
MPEPDTLNDLQPHQYLDIYRENDIPLSDVRRSGLRIVLYLAVGVVLLFIVCGGIITIPRHLVFPFVLKGEMRETIYRFPDNVYIDAIHAAPGEQVRRDDPLATITSPRIAGLIAGYTDALRKREHFLRAEIPLHEARKREAGLREEKARMEIAAAGRDLQHTRQRAESEVRALVAEAEHAASVHRSARELHEAGSVAELDAKGAAARDVAAREKLSEASSRRDKDIDAIRSRAEGLAIERSIAAESIARIDAEIAERRATLDDEVASAYDAIALNYGPFRIDNGGLTLTAPEDGAVAFVFDGERELPSGGMLLKLLPRASDLYALAVVPPELIGYVDEGQRAALKVATFPHYRWGVAQGSVASVTLAPNEKGEYALRASIADPGALRSRLHAGMTGEVMVTVEEQTLLALLFDRLRESYHNVVD